MAGVHRVATEHVLKALETAGRYLEEALEHDGEQSSLEELTEALLADELDLWLILDQEQRLVGAVTTGFLIYTDRAAMEIRTLSTALPRTEWMPLFDVLEAWAKAHNCTEIEMTGRVGWKKVLPELGFGERFVTMVKGIRGE